MVQLREIRWITAAWLSIQLCTIAENVFHKHWCSHSCERPLKGQERLWLVGGVSFLHVTSGRFDCISYELVFNKKAYMPFKKSR